MKFKFFIVALLAIFSCFNSQAQKTYPRFGTAANQNPTYSGQKLTQQYIVDSAGAVADTFLINVNAYSHCVLVTAKDSVALAVNKTSCYLGDELTVIINNTSGSGHIVRFTSKGGATNNWLLSSSGSPITLTASKSATIKFKFNGVGWLEQSRVVQ